MVVTGLKMSKKHQHNQFLVHFCHFKPITNTKIIVKLFPSCRGVSIWWVICENRLRIGFRNENSSEYTDQNSSLYADKNSSQNIVSHMQRQIVGDQYHDEHDDNTLRKRVYVPTYVMAVGSFTVRPWGFPVFWLIQNYGNAHRVHKTLTRCQQNTILFGWAWLTTPTRLGFLFWLTFSVTPRHNGNYDSNTKCKGHQYSSNDLSRCRMHRASDAINSITTQQQLY